MPVVPASFLAMLAGWLAPLLGMAISQMVKSGKTSDIVVTGLWTGIFGFAGWLLILPLILNFGRTNLFGSLRFAWASWAMLGTATFGLLVGSWMGSDAFLILWYPAVMGAVAGGVFSWLIRKKPAAAFDDDKG